MPHPRNHEVQCARTPKFKQRLLKSVVGTVVFGVARYEFCFLQTKSKTLHIDGRRGTFGMTAICHLNGKGRFFFD
jgi:hypothetical protein